MSRQITESKQLNEDRYLDSTLRPYSFDEYIGQDKIKDNLRILIEAANKRKEAIDHILLSGSSGLGKTTLAHIIAKEMNSNIKITSGPAIEKIGDLASILTNLQPGDILFIDEIHRLNKTIEETLYPAMEDFVLDIIIGKGPSARTLQLELPRFTMIGATTRTGLISSPLRSRFGATYRLDFYQQPDIEKIIDRSAKILKVSIDNPEALRIIAQSARQTPRVANRLLKRVRDYSQVRGDGIINQKTSQEALKMLEIDQYGLESADRRLLEIIITKFNGGPIGLHALAASCQEETETIADVHEPYLLQLGFLDRTPRGRIATKLAYNHLGLNYPEDNLNKLL
ncbi:Holliday junction branch migration DNA helicase RuvB [Patescibacteria group bacterium]|nr:Holliday junction branch migration DNA helicase RuvB [Patescibacteria group bacterium]MBU1563670.1 Holliday junction branch migration DNA helicase RuvB [Patescibacteria group bacterium]MBU2068325.1 Holliday junction branch migration DNA helicase RuvB [Patescibacteria group bacterium]